MNNFCYQYLSNFLGSLQSYWLFYEIVIEYLRKNYIRGEKPHRVAALAVRGTLKTWQIDRGQGEYGIGHDDAPPPQLALAYALTVHKSQGSQYDTVLMPVSMATARILYRNLLYTAISRAGKEVILVGAARR